MRERFPGRDCKKKLVPTVLCARSAAVGTSCSLGEFPEQCASACSFKKNSKQGLQCSRYYSSPLPCFPSAGQLIAVPKTQSEAFSATGTAVPSYPVSPNLRSSSSVTVAWVAQRGVNLSNALPATRCALVVPTPTEVVCVEAAVRDAHVQRSASQFPCAQPLCSGFCPRDCRVEHVHLALKVPIAVGEVHCHHDVGLPVSRLHITELPLA